MTRTGTSVGDRRRCRRRRPVLSAAWIGVAFTCAHLRVDRRTVAFYEPETGAHRTHLEKFGNDWPTFRGFKERHGFADRESYSVVLQVDLTPAGAVQTAAHELCHLRQSAPVSEKERESHEAEATA